MNRRETPDPRNPQSPRSCLRRSIRGCGYMPCTRMYPCLNFPSIESWLDIDVGVRRPYLFTIVRHYKGARSRCGPAPPGVPEAQAMGLPGRAVGFEGCRSARWHPPGAGSIAVWLGFLSPDFGEVPPNHSAESGSERNSPAPWSRLHGPGQTMTANKFNIFINRYPLNRASTWLPQTTS